MPVSRAAQVGSNLDEGADSNNGGIGESILRASETDRQRSRSNRLLAAKPSSRKKGKRAVLLPWNLSNERGALCRMILVYAKKRLTQKSFIPPTYQPW